MTLIEIYNAMLAIGEEIKDDELSPPELTKILRGFIGSDDVKVKTHRDANADLNQVIIGGAYDPHEDESNFSSIVIYATFNPAQKVIKISDVDWPQLCVDLIECSGHEMIHQEQYRARDFDIGPHLFVSGSEDLGVRLEQEYLGNPDEIDAYGYSIAVELYLKFQPKRLTSKVVQQSAMYKVYKQAFGVQHPVVKSLLLYSIKYFAQLTSGGSHA